MSAPDRGGSPGDPIAEYLDKLRAGLRVGPGEAELILAEAEDHLRETAAAGLATGMTGREAQEAAISSFGSARAVAHAHRTRLARVARPVDVAMAAWKLSSLLLLAGGVTGVASVMLAVVAASGFHWYFLGFLPSNSSFPFRGGYVIGWPGPTEFSWQVWPVMAMAGALALSGYLLARRRQRRRGTEASPLGPLGRSFPAVATSVFAVITAALFGLALTDAGGAVVGLAACLVLAAVYGFRTPRSLRRQHDRPAWPPFPV
jgi:hypothetical protein